MLSHIHKTHARGAGTAGVGLGQRALWALKALGDASHPGGGCLPGRTPEGGRDCHGPESTASGFRACFNLLFPLFCFLFCLRWEVGGQTLHP